MDMSITERPKHKRYKEISAEMHQLLTKESYFGLSLKDNGKIHGLHDYLTTRGLVVGLDEQTHERRYCYQNREDATADLRIWDGEGHPPGNWIKCKGSFEGEPIDLFNPNWKE